jgi:gamma-glutamyltranspeptidase/glutathione hydrolase
MDDFALKPNTPNAFGVIGTDANAVAPHRRPLSSMSPSFVIGKDRTAVIGAKGGSRIITITLHGILGLERGMSPAQIAAMPRFHHQYLPDVVVAEPGALSPDAIAKLQAMGHVVKVDDKPWTYFLHAVDWNRRDGSLRGGADPRNAPGAAKVWTAPARAPAKPRAKSGVVQ